MSIEIRPAADDDIDAVLTLWEGAAEPTTTDTSGAVAALLGHDPGALLVADDSGEIVGSVIAGWDGWRGCIYRLSVAPTWRRQGLGRRLLAAAEDRLHGLGVPRMHAIVIGADERAITFWQTSDWERQDGQLRFVRS
jgi:ribosomal protein S18 acetylase RimI-like enzyme